uniref:Nuclear receptor domain-containing protein n=1 Tax=Steinernema glaseri TaxID=37863 RepID=A0A1I7ZRE8_9BILA
MDYHSSNFIPQLSEKDLLHYRLFYGDMHIAGNQCGLPDIQEYRYSPPQLQKETVFHIKEEPDFESGPTVVEMPSDSDSDAQTTSSPPVVEGRKIVQFAEDCAVCGDKATGFHYDVASCNGCKTFFRRTVVSGRKFVCHKNGECLLELDKTKRCACRACRFQRCVDVGMNPNAIQYTPSTNLTLSIARKKLKRQFSSCSAPSALLSPLPIIDGDILKRIGDMLHVELKHDRLRNSTFSPYDIPLTVEDILEQQPLFGEADRYPIVQKWPVRFTAPYKPEYRNLGMKFWLYQDLYLSVEYLKTFSFFNKLNHNDQVVLAKEMAMAATALTASYCSFLKGADTVVYPDGHVPFTSLPNFRVELEAVLQKSVVGPVTKLKMDSVQYALMKAMLVLNGDANGLTPEGRDLINDERSHYSTTLLKYLQNRMGGAEGIEQFGKVCQTIILIVNYVQNHRNYFLMRRMNFFRSNPLPPPSRLFEQTIGLLP